MNPSLSIRNTGNWKKLCPSDSIQYSVLMLSSEPLNLKSVKKCFMFYLILSTNSGDYHDGETLQKRFFYTAMLRKNV